MGLDLTVLENIQVQTAQKDFTEPLGYEAGNLAIRTETPARGENTAPHYYRLEKEKTEREKLREAYSAYQQNIKRAGSLRAEVLTGMKRGEDPARLLLKAVECISLMTGDTAIYTQAQEDLLTIYGWGLGEPAPLQEELKQAQKRLKRLEAVQVPTGGERRIQGAILAHRELIQRLEDAIADAEAEKGAEHGQL